MTVIQKKVCLLGDFSVGKTSLVRRFVEGHFDDKYLSTIGVRISRKTLTWPQGALNLLLWDLAGAQEFNTQSSYLIGVAAALIVCDLTRHTTLDSCAKYVQQVRAVNWSAPIVMVGNKLDLAKTRGMGKAFADSLGAPYIETSAQSGEGVAALFETMAKLAAGNT